MATTPQLAPWLIKSLNEDTIFVKLARKAECSEDEDDFDGILSPLPTKVDLQVPNTPVKKRKTFTPIHSPGSIHHLAHPRTTHGKTTSMSLSGKYDHVLIHSIIDPASLPAFTDFLIEMSNYIVAPKNEHSDAVQRAAFYGFGDIHFRVSVFRLLQACFMAEWYWSSEVVPHRWEMLVHIPTRHNITAAQLERFCSFCRNGISCDVIERGINNGLVVFLDRIDKGKNHAGWMRHRLRIACDRHRERMRMQEERDRIRSETGMEFTTSNMLYFYHEWQNTRIDMQALRETIEELNNRNIQMTRRVHENASFINTLCTSVMNIAESMRAELNGEALDALQEHLTRIQDMSRQANSLSNNLRTSSVLYRSRTGNTLDDLLIVVGSDEDDGMVIQ
ncbi:hypothetical protein GUITHDRAFT_145949 [Guillardia theta CCMP2712]|uniref:Uncharacterized protein n=1 Tax=Guillardia theta (strain CCMP2712) TaxID=905079 RepID=L1IG61_GUITC|nr:hypothetical protein GUITHDRAFT_146909 [Guillardia theta CCMP2712]XP_005823107.1 hypothetical protein GUITHDRAFT_145949 [Guillardia theta CCMP2712]EKX34795.1 hypothetical protein GUITHDRAFT_146909 [Guillardia theta CCMP2712]EKX36127.1 hypothetical protein GUITHDRAFT_145949 [Guillardia theta CCMP2712]|eukprot:XP_005821775.1 hypothetical protein GUITHDRAFT_146909 [Guillardia theta CCMP2712]